jgi:hypothetical protein
MREFKDIYKELIEKGEHRFSLYELIQIFIKESDWVGNQQQFLRILSISHEVTGIRLNPSCSACNLESLKNLANWITKNEPIILKELNQVEVKPNNFKHKHKR